jgi:hypothetical protein
MMKPARQLPSDSPFHHATPSRLATFCECLVTELAERAGEAITQISDHLLANPAGWLDLAERQPHEDGRGRGVSSRRRRPDLRRVARECGPRQRAAGHGGEQLE